MLRQKSLNYGHIPEWIIRQHLSDYELGNLIIRYQKESREIQAKCFKLGIPFVKTNHVPAGMNQAWTELVVNQECI